MNQRERFEAWADNRNMDIHPIEYADGSFHYYFDQDTETAWEAWQAACPEGWKIVPEDPTDAMVEAAAKNHEGEFYLPYSLWGSMLAAAPNPEDVCESKQK